MIGGIITDGGGGITPLVAEAEEDINARLDWAGCGRLRTEVGDSPATDGILLIVEGDENLSGLAEMLDGRIPGEEKVPDEEYAIRGETVSHFRSESAAACPVKAGIGISLRLRNQGCDPTTPISDYPSDYGFCSVSASNITAVIRAECLRVGAAILVFALEDAGTHSLRSGGAIATHLANVPDRTLMAIDRWRSLGFMVYIQQQILSFSTGVYVKMSQQPWFRYL